jgi:hypothetical protein
VTAVTVLWHRSCVFTSKVRSHIAISERRLLTDGKPPRLHNPATATIMSIENIVIFNRARMPSPAQWQQAIAAAGFGLRIDRAFDPLAFSGHLPCSDGGVACGFEYFCDNLDQEWSQDLKIELPASWDCVVCLATRSSYDDAAASCAAAAVLASMTGGALLEGGEAPLIAAGKAIAWGLRAVRELRILKRRDEEAEALAALLGQDPRQASSAFADALAALSGQCIEQLVTLEGSPLLGIRFANAMAVRGKRWQLDTPDAGTMVSPAASPRATRTEGAVLAAAKYLEQRLTDVAIRYAELAAEQALTIWFENGARLRLHQGHPLQCWELHTAQLRFEFVERELQITAA